MEFSLNLQLHELPIPEMTTLLTRFQTSFTTVNGDIRKYEEIVNWSNFIETANSYFVDDNNIINCVIIYYGLNAQKELVNYFAFVPAKCSDINATRKEFELPDDIHNGTFRELINNGSYRFYGISSNRMKQLNTTELKNQAISNHESYSQRMQVQHGASSRSVIGNSNTFQDPKMIYFPTQELRELLKDNPDYPYLKLLPGAKISEGNPNGGLKHYLNLYYTLTTNKKVDMNVWSEAQKKAYEMGKADLENVLENPIIELETLQQMINDFRGKAANLGQLCPTKCRGFQVENGRIIP